MDSSLLQPTLTRGLPAPPAYSSDECNAFNECISTKTNKKPSIRSKSKSLSGLSFKTHAKGADSILSVHIMNHDTDIADKRSHAHAHDEKPKLRAKRRIAAVNELISTEITYIDGLNTLLHCYSIPLSKAPKVLKSERHSIIFPPIIQSIIKLNTNLLKSMQSNQQLIGKSMISFIPFLKIYENYMKNHDKATKLLSKIRSSSSTSDTLCVQFLDNTANKTSNLTLESFLILPIQRITRYELVLSEIIKLTDDAHLDKESLIKCHDEIRQINTHINAKLKEYENRLKVHQIESNISNMSFTLVTPSRYFIFKGYLSKVSRKKHIKYLFILFNDLLIYCDDHGAKHKLSFHRKLEIDEYFSIKRVCYLADGRHDYDQSKRFFEIRSLQKSFLCYASSVQEREKWIDLIQKCVDQVPKRNHSHIRYRRSMTEIDGGRMLETAPVFMPHNLTNECMMKECVNKFGVMSLRKRNHCTYCGKLVCSDCSSHKLPHYDPDKRDKKRLFKVCDECWSEHKTPCLLNVDQLNFVSKSIDISKETNDAANDNDESWGNIFEQKDDKKDDAQSDMLGIDDLFGDQKNEKRMQHDSFDDLWNDTKEVVLDTLDFNNENVKNLRLFGFPRNEIESAYCLMKQKEGHKHITVDKGQVFVQTMLDYLSRIR